MNAFTLTRNPAGRLICTIADGTVHANVTPVRAFPLGAPDEGLALMRQEGHEIAWIAQLSNLDAANSTLIEEELTGR